jgi:hypothetical protein
MADVVHDAPQEFWRPPTIQEVVLEATNPPAAPGMAEMCARCGSEYMIGARFCHTCGVRRRVAAVRTTSLASPVTRLWEQSTAWVRTALADFSWRKIPVPVWLHYLHFHEIKRWVGLPTASLVAFFIGLGCVVGAIGVSLFYRASNLAEFQAIQMWRMEWLLAATASFVAGILLKDPHNSNRE